MTPPQNWVHRAKEAQDAIGWANYKDPDEMITAIMSLARIVTDIARHIDHLDATIGGTK